MATGDSVLNNSTTVSTKRHLECALCLESFKSPRILPCFHTFCLACLEQVVQKEIKNSATDPFSCPTCRAKTTIPSGGVGKFQVNFYIEAETEASSATASRDHTVMNFDTITTGAGGSTALTKERYCLQHAEEKLRFYCTKCNSVICRDCKLTSHEGHATTDLSKMASSAKAMLLSVTKEAVGVLRPMLEKIYKEAQSHQKEMPNKKTTALELLQQRSNDLTRAVQAYMEEATKQLNTEADAATKSINCTVEEMRQQLASFRSLCEHVDRVARVGCDADILELPKQVKDFFGLQTTGKKGASRWRSGNQAQHLAIFMDEKWRNFIELKHVIQVKKSLPQQIEQLQLNPFRGFGYENPYAQQDSSDDDQYACAQQGLRYDDNQYGNAYPQQNLRYDGDQYAYAQQDLRYDGDQYAYAQQNLRYDGDQYAYPQQNLRYDGDQYAYPQQNLRYDGDQYAYAQQDLRYDDSQYENSYAQQDMRYDGNPYWGQSVQQYVAGTSSSAVNLEILTQQIGKYIGKVKRINRRVPDETGAQVNLQRVNKKDRRIHQTETNVRQEITKIQRLLANWKTQS